MEKEARILISNMHCTNCSMAIERHFNKLDDIKVNVLLAQNLGVFHYDDSKWNEKLIAKELKKIGYLAAKNKDYSLIRLLISILLTLPFVVNMITMILGREMTKYDGYFQFTLATIIELIAGIPFIKGMLKDFKNKHLGMDVLVSLGTLVAYIYSSILLFFKIDGTLYFETSAMLLTIITLGKTIEKKAKDKTASSLKALMELKKDKAKVKENEQIIIKDIKDIKINDTLVIATGDAIPLDGIISQGEGEINEAFLSGESLPVSKSKDDVVYSGTILVSGNLEIKVTKEENDTYLASLIAKVEEIQTKKPKIQKIADKIASYFVPIILGISLIAFIIFYFKDSLSLAIQRAIAILMVSCPCSLGLATPLAILVGSSRAIKLGIIYNNTDIFEKASKIETICFDKTGTLSKGELQVSKVNKLDNNALDIIYTLESISSHPISKVLVNYAKANNAKLLDLKAKEIPGRGIVANPYFIYKKGRHVYLKEDENIIADLEVIDEIKDNAKEVITILKEKNIKSIMLTGDNENVALKVAKDLDIADTYYEIKPLDKYKIVENLNKKANVCFVGDGINDSLAFQAASLSIAMGSGSEIAKNSADIIISNNNLNSIIKAINLSNKVYKTIITNFIWALAYNLIAIPLAFCGIISPLISGLCMACSSLLVCFNSLRLYKVKVN